MVFRLRLIGKLVTRKYKFWTEPRSCMVLGPKPMEKLDTPRKSKRWTKLRRCIVLGPKPMGKLDTPRKSKH